MASKRKYEDEESNPRPLVHVSRQFQVPKGPKHPKSTWPNAKKPRNSKQSDLNRSREEYAEGGVNALKKRIRDITRRLEHVADLPADRRAEDERAVEDYERQLAAAEATNARTKIIRKYKMVRFFESQKAGRAVKQLRKKLSEAELPEEIERLKVGLHVAEVDLSYTQYSPLCDPYIGIYAKGGFPEEVPRLKPSMWAEVEKTMEEGTAALQQLRDRQQEQFQLRSKPKPKSQSKPKKEPEPCVVDTTGMNRWQRRQALGIAESKKEKETFSVKRTQSYANIDERVERPEDKSEDVEDAGAFFTEA